MEVTKAKEGSEGKKERKKSAIDSAIIEELLKDYQKPEDLTGPGGIMEQLTKRLYERVLGAEMTHFLGYEKGQAPKLEADQLRDNHRNGSSKKTLLRRGWGAGDRGTAGSCRRVRTAVCPQRATALWRL